MTLAAVFHPKAPIVISDVLLSHVGQPTVEVTPTGVFIRPQSGPPTYRPVGFSQKTVLLNEDRVAFTGAGNVSTLKSLACDLRDRIRLGMGIGELDGWLGGRQALCGGGTSAIVAWLDADRYAVGKVGRGVHALDAGEGETAFCCGSGVGWLRRNMIRESNSLETVGEFTDFERMIFRRVAQAGQHLAQERFLGMRDAFGGGFQVTYHDGDRFVPVPQVTYLNFIVEHDGDGPDEMTFSGPLVVQRSNGRRLSFEIWAPEHERFSLTGGSAVLRSRVRFIEKVVPPLLHARTEPWAPPALAVGDYVSAQTVHLRDGRLVGLGSFQLVGDPNLTGVSLEGEPDRHLRLAIREEVFETWRSRFVPVVVKRK